MSEEKLDKMVGGAIKPDRVVLKNVDPGEDVVRRVRDDQSFNSFTQVLRKQAQEQYDSFGDDVRWQLARDDPNILAYMGDYRPRNQIAFFQYSHHFQQHPEENIVDAVSKLYTGKGSSHDHHHLHQLFIDSFQHYPELVSLYTQH